MLKVYNTLGKELQEFKPQIIHKVKIYHCGPTVYWTQHIGNLRAMTLGDLIRRSLIFLGNDVTYVRNYTDFGHLTGDNIGDADTGNDRIEKASMAEHLSPKQVADKYIRQFEDDVSKLNLLEPSKKTRATDYIEDMKIMVSELLRKGFAYETPEAIYFDVSKFHTYTDLSHQRLDKNITGAGFGDQMSNNKRHPQDFALWFFKTGSHENSLQTWISDFHSPNVSNGEGIPGWHIECSSMARATLGKTLDIHMGGIEHIPIHHTNEIAQSESANGVKYVNYWLHNEHLTLDSEKMSKSEGNVLFLKDILERGYSGVDLRYFFLQAHYRSKQNFTWAAMDGAANGLKRFRNDVKNHVTTGENLEPKIDNQYMHKFKDALEEDFNIPKVLAVAWKLLKSDSKYIYSTILKFDEVLGLDLEKYSTTKSTKPRSIGFDEQRLLDERLIARKNGDYMRSDEIRGIIRDKYGYNILDGTDNSQTLTMIHK